MSDIFLSTFGPSFPGLPIGPRTPGSPCLGYKYIMNMGVSTHRLYLINNPNRKFNMCHVMQVSWSDKYVYSVCSKLPAQLMSYSYLFSHHAFYSLRSRGPFLSFLPRQPWDSRLAQTAGILPMQARQEAKVVAQIRFHQVEQEHCIFVLYYVISPGWRTRPQLTQSVL